MDLHIDVQYHNDFSTSNEYGISSNIFVQRGLLHLLCFFIDNSDNLSYNISEVIL